MWVCFLCRLPAISVNGWSIDIFRSRMRTRKGLMATRRSGPPFFETTSPDEIRPAWSVDYFKSLLNAHFYTQVFMWCLSGCKHERRLRMGVCDGLWCGLFGVLILYVASLWARAATEDNGSILSRNKVELWSNAANQFRHTCMETTNQLNQNEARKKWPKGFVLLQRLKVTYKYTSVST